MGIEASEAFPILLFIGIGAMIDFEPLLQRPILALYGFAAHLGIFVAIGLIAFIFDTVGGVLAAKIMNLFTKEKLNPIIGGILLGLF